MTGGADTDWIACCDAAAPDSPPRPTLTAALDAWGAAPPGHAADLGCGGGHWHLFHLVLRRPAA